MFIHVTGDRGISIYEATPKSMRNSLIGVFKRKPKAVLGITRIHFLFHSIKVLKKYHLAVLLLPVTVFSLILSLIHEYLIWAIFISSSGYLFKTVILKPKQERR